MKTLTIHQPWAALLAYRIKIYETRGWSCRYRGPLAIHASKSNDSLKWLATATDPNASEVRRIIQMHDLWQAIRVQGAIIATGELRGIYRAEEIIAYEGTTRTETLLGNFGAGRYGWEIANVELLPLPVIIRGAQGLWEWDGVQG